MTRCTGSGVMVGQLPEHAGLRRRGAWDRGEVVDQRIETPGARPDDAGDLIPQSGDLRCASARIDVIRAKAPRRVGHGREDPCAGQQERPAVGATPQRGETGGAGDDTGGEHLAQESRERVQPLTHILIGGLRKPCGPGSSFDGNETEMDVVGVTDDVDHLDRDRAGPG